MSWYDPAPHAESWKRSPWWLSHLLLSFYWYCYFKRSVLSPVYLKTWLMSTSRPKCIAVTSNTHRCLPWKESCIITSVLCVFRHHFSSPSPTTMRPEDSWGGNPDRPKAESPTDTDLHVHTCRERKKKPELLSDTQKTQNPAHYLKVIAVFW